jgi:hypothetical protein
MGCGIVWYTTAKAREDQSSLSERGEVQRKGTEPYDINANKVYLVGYGIIGVLSSPRIEDC